MSSGGKYVRAPTYSDDSEEYIDCSIDDSNVKVEQSDEETSDSINEVLESESENDELPNANRRVTGTTESGDQSALRNENQDYVRRAEALRDQLNQLVEELGTRQPLGSTSSAIHDDDRSWNTGFDAPGPSTSTGSMRWDNIQPFPNDVPANRMWEQWNRFIDRFEIATSVSNVFDPVKRSQILFLSMGEKLQRIVRASRLRPSLREPNCYQLFVKNIENYLQSMVDITAEHETFSNLRQEPDEPMITFHARLMEKVRLCRYSSTDEDRFVRMQLLKGMRNKELAKAARTFGYETAFIVQSATREETFEAEVTSSGPSRAFAVVRHREVSSFSGSNQRKRRYNSSNDGQNQAKKQRREDESKYRGGGRRSRCPKCHRMYHKFGTCPAENRKCNACGTTGHFAVACRRGSNQSANAVQTQHDHVPGWTDEEDEKEKKVNE